MKTELNAAILLLFVTCAVGAADWLIPDKPNQPDHPQYGKWGGSVQVQWYERRETNVVTGDNHSGCSTCEGIRKNHWLLYHPYHDGGLPYVPPTERWQATNVTVVTTYVAFGTNVIAQTSRTIEGQRRVWRLESDWKEINPVTIQIISGGGGGFGNGITISNSGNTTITNLIVIPNAYFMPQTNGTR